MKSDVKYEGWANWATWNLMLWTDNEEPIYRAKVSLIRSLDPRDDKLADQILAFFREQFPEGTPDMSPEDMFKVDWDEVVQHIVDEAKEYE